MNKKIFLSLCLILCIAISISAVTANDVATSDNEDNVVSASNHASNTLKATHNVNTGDKNVVSASNHASNTLKATYDNIEDVDGINNAINTLQDGDTINFKANAEINVGNNSWNINKTNIVINGNNANIKIDGESQKKWKNTGTFNLNGNNITLKDFIFTNLDNSGKTKPYGQEVYGIPVTMQGNNQTVDNIKSYNFNKGVFLLGATDAKITNCYFNGSTQYAAGDVPEGKKESGTYGIGGGRSTNILVEGCTFDGQLLDGISFYQNSKNYIVRNNTFNNNVYAIFFGGASTRGSEISGNKFIKCGHCDDADGNLIYSGLAVISTQKSSDGYKIINNNFTVCEDSVVIKAESGNTSHGYPSDIGDIVISNNKVDVDSGVNPKSILFIHILSNAGPLNPSDDISITGNTLEPGINLLSVWYNDWGNEGSNDIVIPKAEKISTSLNIVNISTSDKQITVLLKEFNGDAIAAVPVSYTMNGKTVNTTTDEEGKLTIYNVVDGTIEFSFAGDNQYKESSTSIDFKSDSELIETIEKLNKTIKEQENTINTTKEELKTSQNQIAELIKAINTLNATITKQTKTINNLKTKVATQTKTINNLNTKVAKQTKTIKNLKAKLTPKATSIAAAKKTFKVKAKTKKFTATLKTNGKALKGKYISFTVNKKTYVVKTNSKGVATLSLNLTKKGTYKVTMKFDGDAGYKAAKKAVNVVIK